MTNGRLRERREAQGLSRHALAARARVLPSVLVSYELGRTGSLRLHAALRVAEALGVDTSALRELYGYGDGDEDGGAS